MTSFNNLTLLENELLLRLQQSQTLLEELNFTLYVRDKEDYFLPSIDAQVERNGQLLKKARQLQSSCSQEVANV